MASLKSPNTRNTHKDAAFLSYLVNRGGEKYIHKLVESAQNHSHAVPNSEDDDRHHHRNYSRKKKPAMEDGEIDVFSADKYFNSGKIDGNNNKSLTRTTSDHLGVIAAERRCKTGDVMVDGGYLSRPQTPSSIYSESSMNSQSALIRKLGSQKKISSSSSRRSRIGIVGIDKKKKHFLANLACSCTCSGKEAVDVHDHHQVKDSHNVDRGRAAAVVKGAGFLSSHIQSPIRSSVAMKMNLQPALDFIKSNKLAAVPTSDTPKTTIQEEEEKSRKSLDVFGATITDQTGANNENFNLEESLNMLSWDAIPQAAEEIEIRGPKKSLTDETATINYTTESRGSDASSDLFELECISRTTTTPMTRLPRPPPEESDLSSITGGGVVSNSCYAPSEASVEWSVVTASMAEFSLVSDSDDQTTEPKVGPKGNKIPTMGQNDAQKKRASGGGGGLLSGCKSQKSVRVAEHLVPLHKKTPTSPAPASGSVGKSYKPLLMSRFQPDAVQHAGLSPSSRRSRTDLLRIQ